MEGRWTLRVDAAGRLASLLDVWQVAQPVATVPVVPCDDAAVERVALAIHEKNLHLSRATCRERATDFLRAAGETP